LTASTVVTNIIKRQRFYVWLEISAGFKMEECLT